jgi:hypothetical protein
VEGVYEGNKVNIYNSIDYKLEDTIQFEIGDGFWGSCALAFQIGTNLFAVGCYRRIALINF